MNLEEYENHNLIFESVWRTIGLTLVSATFVFIALLTDIRGESAFMFWGSVILFGTGTIVGLIKLLNPRNLFLRPGSDRIKEYESLYSERAKSETGIFNYVDGGFEVDNWNEKTKFLWKDIETIVGYKRDLYTYDNICLDIHFENGAMLDMNEDTRGWHQFNSRTQSHLAGINQNWQMLIAKPAFESNFMVVFDKANRPLETVMKRYYPNEKSL